MMAAAWLFVGVVALLASGWALWTNDDALAVLTGVTGFVLWGVWSYGALSVEVYRDATVYQFSEPAVAIVGLLLAMLPGWIALTGPIEVMARYRRPGERDL